MIKTFVDKETEKIFHGERSRKLPVAMQQKVRMLLRFLNAVSVYEDLRFPPSNRLHSLKGDLAGFDSISINMQYRIIFCWKDGDASKVKITDYH